jgi:hypothetical protein
MAIDSVISQLSEDLTGEVMTVMILIKISTQEEK